MAFGSRLMGSWGASQVCPIGESGLLIFQFDSDAAPGVAAPLLHGRGAWNSSTRGWVSARRLGTGLLFFAGDGMSDSLRTDPPIVTRMLFRHSEFSAAEMEAVRQLVGHSIAAVERELICETLVRRGGNRTHAATILGISIRALRNKIQAYRIRGREMPEPNGLFRPAPDADPCDRSNRCGEEAPTSE